MSLIPVGMYSESLTSSFLTPLPTHTHAHSNSNLPLLPVAHLVSLWVLRSVFLGDTTEPLVQMTAGRLFCGLPPKIHFKIIWILFWPSARSFTPCNNCYRYGEKQKVHSLSSLSVVFGVTWCSPHKSGDTDEPIGRGWGIERNNYCRVTDRAGLEGICFSGTNVKE